MISTMQSKEPTKLAYPNIDIHVTAEIIKTACHRRSRHCMIADAIRNHIPSATNIEVDLMTIRYSMPERGLRYIFHTPRKPQMALIHFDRGRCPVPFKFRLHSGHIVSMRTGDKQRHNFGRAKMSVKKQANGGTETVIVGGKPPPRLPPHPSHNGIRRFGLGGFTGGDGSEVLGWTVDADGNEI
jgi:hypothetical protein